MIPNLAFSVHEVENFCQRWHVIRFALFGSVLRDDFNSESDVDVLVQFAPNTKISISILLDMEEELEQLFGRAVDLGEWQTVKSDPNYIRRKIILESAKVVYEK
jgi:uncharacterized protein